MPAYGVNVVILAGKSEQEIKSPDFDSKEAAEAELAKVTEGQKNAGEVLTLPWFSTLGTNIVAAYVDERPSKNVTFA